MHPSVHARTLGRGLPRRRVTDLSRGRPRVASRVAASDLPRVPDPELLDLRRPGASRARSSGSATRSGPRRSTGCTTTRWSGRSIPTPTRIRGGVSSAPTRSPAPPARARRAGRRGASHVPGARRADDLQRAAPGRLQLLHAAAAGDVDRRRGARPMDPAGRRRVARGSGRRVRRGGGHPLAPRPRRLAAGRLGRADLAAASWPT